MRAIFQEVNFHGYLLPTDTVLLMNLHSVHYDPKTFENPEEFQPNRFVNAKGEFDGPKAEKVIPFGYGKRKCVGMHDVFFLFSTRSAFTGNILNIQYMIQKLYNTVR